ncbi:MAG: ATP-grasp domain-containing protein, partial [Anaerolineae bacterium]
IPCPRTRLVTSDENFEQSLNCLSFPALLKPVRGSDGKGIQIFNDSVSLIKTLEKNKDFAGQYIVQSFIDGYDIDCNVLCQDGKILAHTIQKGFIFRGRQFAPPAGIEFVQNEQIFEIVNRWVSATRWTGVAHLDLR